MAPSPQAPWSDPAGLGSANADAKATRPWFKKKRFILPIAILLFVVVGSAMAGGDKTAAPVAAPSVTQTASAPVSAPAPAPAPSSASAPAPSPSAEAAIPGIGAKGRDGKFEFVVTGVERPGASFKSQFGTTETAQGEFIIIRVNVTNIGDEAQTLMSSGQVLFNDKGQKFEPSSALFSLEGAEKFFLQNINPGNTIKGAPLLFDVPAGTKVATIELHDSMFSGGVKIALT